MTIPENDPFSLAPDPADEPAPTVGSVNAQYAKPAGEPAPEGFTLSLKTDERYDAALSVFRFPNITEANRYLSSPEGGKEIIGVVQSVQRLVAKNRELSTAPARSGGAGQSSGGKPPGADGPPSWAPPAPSCGHGTRKYVTKTGAKGQWHAWGCTGPQGDSCDPGLVFFNKPK